MEASNRKAPRCGKRNMRVQNSQGSNRRWSGDPPQAGSERRRAESPPGRQNRHTLRQSRESKDDGVSLRRRLAFRARATTNPDMPNRISTANAVPLKSSESIVRFFTES
jgi:hypothetical protein